MTGYSSVGRNVVRNDARLKALGRAGFTSDIELPRMLHVRVLGSPHAHARLLSIDTAEAARVPGVRCVITDADAPRRLWGRGGIADRPILAREVVRFAGEPVAAVAADTPEAAAEAVAAIRVEYAGLPAVFDVEQAAGMSPPAVVHPGFAGYHKGVRPARLDPDRPNIFMHMKIRKGDIEKGFAEADIIRENRFVTPPVQHCALEPHAVVVQPETDGGVTIYSSRQSIWDIRGEISVMFGIPASRIRVAQQFVGGGFGSKIDLYEFIPTLLALRTGRPVKWVYTREEVFVLGGQRETAVTYIRDGMKKDGTLVAREMKVFLNAGAYSGIIAVVTRNASFAAVSPYRTPNFRWDSWGVYTNEPPRTAYRGFGSTEVDWAIESSMDIMAHELGIDPVTIRKKNFLKEGEPNITNEITHSIAVEECLERAAGYIGLDEKRAGRGPYRYGKGVAIGGKYSLTPTTSEARVRINEDETVTVYHSADEIGQGVNTVVAQVAAEELGIPASDVRVVFSDTGSTPFFAGGSTGSRVTYNLGRAVRLACQDAARVIRRRAAERLGAAPDDIEVKGKEIFVKSEPQKKMPVAELFRPFMGRPVQTFGGAAPGGEIIGTATFFQEGVGEDQATGLIDPEKAAQGKRLNAFYTYVAKAAEVEVNTETGVVKVIRCASAADIGQAINPKMCRAQLEGGLGMGIGDAVYEEAVMEDGHVLNPSFTDYRMPSAAQMPSTQDTAVFLVESAPHKDGPFGAKGIGEAAMIAMQPAIASAVFDATGVRIKELPLSPEKVLAALREAEKA